MQVKKLILAAVVCMPLVHFSSAQGQTVRPVSGIEASLETYGQSLAASTPARAIEFVRVEKTGSGTYKMIFKTSSAAFMSDPNARTDKVAFASNLGRTKIWETKFCTQSLKDIASKSSLSMVFGELQNTAGVLQSGSFCTKDSSVVQASAAAPATPVKTVGVWYDDVGSPTFLNATFTIQTEGDRTVLVRRNGDGSQGTYDLSVAGNNYVKVGDKNGAYYVVTSDGLKIYDRQGYVRTAKLR